MKCSAVDMRSLRKRVYLTDIQWKHFLLRNTLIDDEEPYSEFIENEFRIMFYLIFIDRRDYIMKVLQHLSHRLCF